MTTISGHYRRCRRSSKAGCPIVSSAHAAGASWRRAITKSMECRPVLNDRLRDSTIAPKLPQIRRRPVGRSRLDNLRSPPADDPDSANPGQAYVDHCRSWSAAPSHMLHSISSPAPGVAAIRATPGRAFAATALLLPLLLTACVATPPRSTPTAGCTCWRARSTSCASPTESGPRPRRSADRQRRGGARGRDVARAGRHRGAVGAGAGGVSGPTPAAAFAPTWQK